MSESLESRIEALERQVERLEGALEAHVAMLVARASIANAADRAPYGSPSGIELWEYFAFREAVLAIGDAKPAAAASERAAGYELVERQITAALHWAAPSDD